MQHVQTDQYNSDFGFQFQQFMLRPLCKFWFRYCHVSTTPYTLLMTTQTNNTAKIMNMKDVKKAENKDSKDKKRKQLQGKYDTLDHEYRKALHQYQQAAHSIHHETCQHHHIA